MPTGDAQLVRGGSSSKRGKRRGTVDAPTSGVPVIDDLIDGVRVGDNLVVTSDGVDAGWIVDRFAAAVDRKRLVMIDVTGEDRAAQPAAVLDWSARGRRRTPRPQVARDQLARADADVGEGASFALDSLSALADSWDEDAALDLFLWACPRLYRRGSVALWIVDARRHGRGFLNRLTDVTQVVVHLAHVDDQGEDAVLMAVRKADGRPGSVVGRRAVGRVVDGHMTEARVIAPDRRRLAEIVKTMRANRSVGQAELARRVGVSPSALSQVERGVRGVSAETLIAICDALGVPFAPDDPLQRGYRLGRRAGQQDERVVAGVTGRRLADHVAATLWRLTLDPRASGNQPLFSSKGTEVIHVTSGVVDLEVSGRAETLHEGDTITVDAAVVEGWANPSDTAATLLWYLKR